ncbi:MAG: glycosyltransferase [Bacteroidia bacterium]|nr:glycosyltransferase [Bacteroidia bacterium]
MAQHIHILFLTQAAPFPPVGGENIRSRGLIYALLACGYEVSAITCSSESPRKSDLLHPYKFPENKRKSILQHFKSLFYTIPDVNTIITNIHNQRTIDIAIIDYFFLGQYIPFFKKLEIPVVYGTHNAQSELTRQEIKILKGIEKIKRYGAWQFQKLHEKKFFPQANHMIVVSEEDKQRHCKYLPDEKITVVPNFIDPTEYVRNEKTENYLVISGNFNSFQNRYGTEWFLREVWEAGEFWNQTKLMLVGIGSDNFLHLMQKKLSCKNATATGKVESITEFIGNASLSIVPVFHGSGSRFKILEALALGCPVISTSKGAEGIDSENIEIADTREEFRRQIALSLHAKNNISLSNKYTSKANQILLEQIIRLILKEPIY